MKITVAILFLAIFAQAKDNHKHREHGAHAHGAGNLSIAFDGTIGKIEFKIPSESIFGFEYAAKSEKDKKKQADGLTKLENKISEMLSFDTSISCKISKSKIEVVAESDKHSSTQAEFNVSCEKSPVGTEITFNFQKHFPKIKDLEVQVIADNVQKSVEVSKNNTKLLLK